MEQDRELELKELKDLERRFLIAAKKHKSSEQSSRLAEIVVKGIREGVKEK